jgi:hypothetical protein
MKGENGGWDDPPTDDMQKYRGPLTQMQQVGFVRNPPERAAKNRENR